METKNFCLKTSLFLVAVIGLFFPVLSIQGQDEPIQNVSNIDSEELNWKKNYLEVTMYTLGECGKLPSHPAYGITASGKKVVAGRTVAASPEIPFGSKIKIPGFDTTFVAEDRGGMIKTYRGKWPGIIKIDIYTTDKAQALKWGRRKVQGELLVLEK